MDGFEGFAGAMHDCESNDSGGEAGSGVRLFARTGGRVGAPPLLLLHGFPQTHAMWQRVASLLADDFSLVVPDLRGYGDSDKPDGDDPTHALYAKRAMAADVAALMQSLGHATYAVAGHDRGGRVAHRLALDFADRVERLALLDIAPTLDMYAATDMRFASAYHHWFHLIQPQPLPERMIGGDPAFYLRWALGGNGVAAPDFFVPAALVEYERCFGRADAIHAACEDYRAAATIDLVHDRASRAAGEKIACDLLVLWSERGVVEKLFDPMQLWRAQCAGDVAGAKLAAGHFLAEELPEETAARLRDFLLAC